MPPALVDDLRRSLVTLGRSEMLRPAESFSSNGQEDDLRSALTAKPNMDDDSMYALYERLDDLREQLQLMLGRPLSFKQRVEGAVLVAPQLGRPRTAPPGARGLHALKSSAPAAQIPMRGCGTAVSACRSLSLVNPGRGTAWLAASTRHATAQRRRPRRGGAALDGKALDGAAVRGTQGRRSTEGTGQHVDDESAILAVWRSSATWPPGAAPGAAPRTRDEPLR